MTSITLNLDKQTDNMIRKLAREKGWSLNQTIQNILKKALGIETDTTVFEKFCGVWSKEELKEFGKNTKEFEKINKEDWV